MESARRSLSRLEQFYGFVDFELSSRPVPALAMARGDNPIPTGLFQIEHTKNQNASTLLPRGIASTMPSDSHQRAAEFHELAAHAHRAAAVHHGKQDHQTGHEHSQQALEHAAKAFQHSQEANRKSAEAAGKP